MSNKKIISALAIFFSSHVFSGQVTIINNDGPNEGLNDLTPAIPIDGNNEETLGGQRLFVLQMVADFIETIFDFDVEIKIDVEFNPLGYSYLGGNTLARAGANTYYSANDFPVINVNYPVALVNQFRGYDLQTSESDISVTFNSDIPNVYLGLKSQSPLSSNSHLFGTMLHEIIHGLGFSKGIGQDGSSVFSSGKLKAFDLYLKNSQSGLTFDEMTIQQRSDTLVSSQLEWNGAKTKIESLWISNNFPSNNVSGHSISGNASMYAPSSYRTGSSGSHFDAFLKPDEIMEHAQNTEDPKHHVGLAKQVLEDIGWDIYSSGDKPLISLIKNASILNDETYQPKFALFDNDNFYHRADAYDWTPFNDSPRLIMEVIATSSNQSVVPDGNITISGVTAGISTSGESLRQLSIIPVSNSSGVTTISITAADSDGNTFTESFVLTVIDPNTPPTIFISSPVEGYKFFTPSQIFQASANDEEDGSLTNINWEYKAFNDINFISLGSNQNATLSLPDGSYTIRACVSDSRGDIACDEINIFVSVFGDEDNDGLNNSSEIAQGTDPYDSDSDNDGVFDGSDDEPLIFSDVDLDSVGDGFDNCVLVANSDQANFDNDALGDACDPDIDGDGVDNIGDAFDYDPTEISDTDIDGVGDNSDNCPTVSNIDQSNIDGDASGDACDLDIDNDGFSNNIENKFGTDPSDDSDITNLMDKILAYSNQDDPEKNVPLMGLSGLFMLGVSLLTLRIWRLRK